MSVWYTFHPLADAKQDEIWYYSYQQWGMQQADKYIDGLHALLQTVAEDIKHPKVRTLPERRWLLASFLYVTAGIICFFGKRQRTYQSASRFSPYCTTAWIFQRGSEKS